MKDIKNKITILIIFLIIVFAVLIAFNILRTMFLSQKPRASNPPAQGTAQTSPQQGASQGKAPPSGGAQAGAQGKAPAGNASAAGSKSGAAPAGGKAAGAQGGAARGTAVRVTPVKLDTVENSIIINGDVLSSQEVSIYPTMAGKITALRVRSGDRVSRGQVVAVVDPSRPGDSFFPNPVTSTVSGAVVSVPVSVGETVQTNTAICVIGNINDLRVETYVPERYSVTMRRGLPAQVSFEAMPGETFPAEVDELSPVIDPASRTMRIRLRLVPQNGRIDPRILAGMFATVSLVTNSHVNVPVVPRNALISTYDSWIVFVVEPGTEIAKRKEVTLGLESETMVEIASGLEDGEQVITAGQNFLSDGDPVRIVE